MPFSREKPSVPTNASRTLRPASVRSATGPTIDSVSRRNSPPVSVICSAGLSRAYEKTRVELVTTWTSRLPIRWRTTSAVVVPASIMIVSPSRTSSAAARAIRVFCSTFWC